MEKIDLEKERGRLIIPRESEKEVRFDLMNHDALFRNTIVYNGSDKIPWEAFELLSVREREYLFNSLFEVDGIE